MSRGDEPAYPSHGSMGEVVQTGMTLREYYAGLAMQGMLANNLISDVIKAAKDRAAKVSP